MKKFYTYLTMALMVTTMATLMTSCDDNDAMEARTLNGTWTGYIDTYYADRWGVTGNSYRTTIYFDQRDAYGGTGYEVDYNVNSRYQDYYYCEFDWEVWNGEIRIRYADSYNDVFIYDYELYSDYFEGYMDDGSNRDIHFQLYYDGRFDWNPYWTRGITRGTGSERFHASGEFARQAEASQAEAGE